MRSVNENATETITISSSDEEESQTKRPVKTNAKATTGKSPRKASSVTTTGTTDRGTVENNHFMEKLVKGLPKGKKPCKILNDLRIQGVDKEDLIKAALLVQLPRKIRKTLKTLYYLPSTELAESAEELMDFPPKKDKAEQKKVSINETQTNHKKEIVNKKLSKLLEFWPANPETWFKLVEELFQGWEINDDGYKFNYFIKESSALKILDVIERPPEKKSTKQ